MTEPTATTSSDQFGALRSDDDATLTAHFEREYATDITVAWSVLTEPDRVARWLAPIRLDGTGAGARFHVEFDDGLADFTIERCDPPRSLTVRWIHDDGPSTVHVELTSIDVERTRLTLAHTRLRPEVAPFYAAGWHFYLDVFHTQAQGGRHPDWEIAWPKLTDTYQSLAGTMSHHE